MKLPKYRITYPDNQSQKLSRLRDEIKNDGLLEDGSLHGWSLVQRLGNTPKGDRLSKPFLEIQVFEIPTGVLPNRARQSQVEVALFWFGKESSENFKLAREKTALLESIIVRAHPSLQGWTSLQPAEVDVSAGLFVAYVGDGQVVHPPKIETI